MHELLNVLYVVTQGAYVRLDHDTLRVEVERSVQFRAPLVRLAGLVCFGNVMISPHVLHRCADSGITVALLTARGDFRARVEGPQQGNVLLRRAQHLALSDEHRTMAIARQFVAAKIQNSRQVLVRAAREAATPGDGDRLRAAAASLAAVLGRLAAASTLDAVRGGEGEAARAYFEVFEALVREDRAAFAPHGRSRRPPRDRTNALLSFLYALLRAECAGALEGVGLDPQVGYLHALRPGRPALALDLMEELRSVLADRLALTLINRRQLGRDDFEVEPGGAVYLTEAGRRTVVAAYQKRKSDLVDHRVLGRSVPLGLVPHVQARLLARHLRDDLAHYPPFQTRT